LSETVGLEKFMIKSWYIGICTASAVRL